MQMERDGVSPERITIVVRNGPDLERLQPVEPDPDLMEKGVTLIGFAGEMGVPGGVYGLSAQGNPASCL